MTGDFLPKKQRKTNRYLQREEEEENRRLTLALNKPAANEASSYKNQIAPLKSPAIPLEDIRAIASKNQRQAEEFGASYLPKARRTQQDASREKALYQNWENAWQKVQAGGVGALTEEEQAVWEPFHRYYRTDDAKRSLLDGLYATLDKKSADAGALIGEYEQLKAAADASDKALQKRLGQGTGVVDTGKSAVLQWPNRKSIPADTQKEEGSLRIGTNENALLARGGKARASAGASDIPFASSQKRDAAIGKDGDEEVYYRDIYPDDYSLDTQGPLDNSTIKNNAVDSANRKNINPDDYSLDVQEALEYSVIMNNAVDPTVIDALEAKREAEGKPKYSVAFYTDDSGVTSRFDGKKGKEPFREGDDIFKGEMTNMCAEYVGRALEAGGFQLDDESLSRVDCLYAEIVGGMYRDKKFDPHPAVKDVIVLAENGPKSQGGRLSVEQQYTALVQDGIVEPGDIIFFASADAESDLSHVGIVSKVDDQEIYYNGETKSRFERPTAEYFLDRRNIKKAPYLEIIQLIKKNKE